MDNNQLNNNPVNNQPNNTPVNNQPINNNPAPSQETNTVVNTPVNNNPVNNNPVNNQVNNQINNKEVQENEKKGRGMFYGIIAIAIFIIMAVGATYAYFTASTNSSDSAVKTKSAKVELDFISYEEAWLAEKLIPADTVVAEYAFENQDDSTEQTTTSGAPRNSLCKDDQGNDVCSVYVFQVRNTSSGSQTVKIELESIANQFANLHAMAYEISRGSSTLTAGSLSGSVAYETTGTFSIDTGNGTTIFKNGQNDPLLKKTEADTGDPITVKLTTGENSQDIYQKSVDNLNGYQEVYVNRKGTEKTLLQFNDTENPGTRKPSVEIAVQPDGSSVTLADSITIFGTSQGEDQNVKTFAIVLYIKNIDQDQTAVDGEKEFTGRVIVSPSGSDGGVYGTIGAISGQLQSGLSTTTTTPTVTPGP